MNLIQVLFKMDFMCQMITLSMCQLNVQRLTCLAPPFKKKKKLRDVMLVYPSRSYILCMVTYVDQAP